MELNTQINIDDIDDYDIFCDICFKCLTVFLIFLGFVGLLFLSICFIGFFVNIFFCLFKYSYCEPMGYVILIYGIYGFPIVTCVIACCFRTYLFYRRIVD